ncbi:IgGFc-binding protein isoform X1 [Chaetoceros tenuissimus]|uniref:IgGFc-binding protein isoform X1 n=1 Tax=Chaetoceros tenuissimus TaxID=426638 RepID=A0AAD3D212_9STRA|nr:IgGFc-binding protein isoform X1 [Chaetoceros tenuissimus]
MRFHWNIIIHSFLLTSGVAVVEEYDVETVKSNSKDHHATHHYLRSLFHRSNNIQESSSNNSKTGVIRKRNLNPSQKWVLGSRVIHWGASGRAFCQTTNIKGDHITDESLCIEAAEEGGFESNGNTVPSGNENAPHGCYIIQNTKKYYYLNSGADNDSDTWLGAASAKPLCAKPCEEGEKPDPNNNFECKPKCVVDNNCVPLCVGGLVPNPCTLGCGKPCEIASTCGDVEYRCDLSSEICKDVDDPEDANDYNCVCNEEEGYFLNEEEGLCQEPPTPTPPTPTPPTPTPPTPTPPTPTPPTPTPPTPTPPTPTPPTPTPPTPTPSCPVGTFRQDSKCLTPCKANSGMCDEDTEYCEDADNPESIDDYECLCNEGLYLDPDDGVCKEPCSTDPLEFVCGCDAEIDSATYKFTRDWFLINGGEPEEVDCAYLTQHTNDEVDEKRIGRYCLKPEIKTECSFSCCDFQCEDDPEYTFLSLNGDFERNCNFISKPQLQEVLDRRRELFCYEDAEQGILSDVGVNCPDACGLCGTPPIIPPPSDECTDSESFTWVLGNGVEQTCDYILKNNDDKKDANRISVNCPRGDVRGACKSSCDACKCEDDEDFLFTLIRDSNEERGCDYIEAKPDVRRQKYCFEDETCTVPSIVGNACVKACGFCDEEDRSDVCEPYPPSPPIDTTCPERTNTVCGSRGTFWYVVTGGSCTWSNNCLPEIEDRKEWSCEESGPFDEFSENGYTLKINGQDPETPSPTGDGLYYHGDIIVVTTEETNTEILSTDSNGNTQSVTFHSSCSRHFEISDTYGILTMIGFHNEDGAFGYNVPGVYKGGKSRKK